MVGRRTSGATRSCRLTTEEDRVAMEVVRAGTSKVEEGATSKEEEAGTAEDTKPGRSHLLDLGLGVEVLLLAVQTRLLSLSSLPSLSS